MKKTPFNIKRREVQKRIKQNISVDKKDFFELIRRASRAKSIYVPKLILFDLKNPS